MDKISNECASLIEQQTLPSFHIEVIATFKTVATIDGNDIPECSVDADTSTKESHGRNESVAEHSNKASARPAVRIARACRTYFDALRFSIQFGSDRAASFPYTRTFLSCISSRQLGLHRRCSRRDALSSRRPTRLWPALHEGAFELGDGEKPPLQRCSG